MTLHARPRRMAAGACRLAVAAALAVSAVACTSDTGSVSTGGSTAAPPSSAGGRATAEPSAAAGSSAAGPASSVADASGTPGGSSAVTSTADATSPDATLPDATLPGAAGGSSTAALTSGGAIEGAPVTKAPAIDLTATGDLGAGVTAKIAQISALQATAQLPGEVAGAAVSLTFEIDNAGSSPIGLTGVSVTLTDSAGHPGTATTGNSAAPFAGMIVPGGKAQATYVFVVPAEARNPITVTVAYSSSAPSLVFSGQAPAS